MDVSHYMKEKGISFEHSLESVKKDPLLREMFHETNLSLTKKSLQTAASDDMLLLQAVDALEELDKTFNLHTKRLREWFEWTLPEYSRKTPNHERFVEGVSAKKKEELMKDIGASSTMGTPVSEQDMASMIVLAKFLENLIQTRKTLEAYIEAIVRKHLPNATAILGPALTGKLAATAGSFNRMVRMPASTIQLLGAEKALFRHLTSGARSPKYGLIFQHHYFSKVPRKDQGKLARMMADKVTIAIKVDYYKGEFCGDALKKQIEKRFGIGGER